MCLLAVFLFWFYFFLKYLFKSLAVFFIRLLDSLQKSVSTFVWVCAGRGPGAEASAGGVSGGERAGFAVMHRFVLLYFHFHPSQSIFVFSISSLTLWLFSSMLSNLHIFMIFPVIFL
ncbi:unnamed protein product [Nyctereutes procyonoides]|uniref:(raccoon dog) hypothetical protein n=1 Tax=Nyctereutes procyonoides TaxID=34880 RepID=A0A811ZQM2_NYCPR|nr:unnamed protein product [Nyctereutes procyonoides]